MTYDGEASAMSFSPSGLYCGNIRFSAVPILEYLSLVSGCRCLLFFAIFSLGSSLQFGVGQGGGVIWRSGRDSYGFSICIWRS